MSCTIVRRILRSGPTGTLSGAMTLTTAGATSAWRPFGRRDAARASPPGRCDLPLLADTRAVLSATVKITAGRCEADCIAMMSVSRQRGTLGDVVVRSPKQSEGDGPLAVPLTAITCLGRARRVYSVAFRCSLLGITTIDAFDEFLVVDSHANFKSSNRASSLATFLSTFRSAIASKNRSNASGTIFSSSTSMFKASPIAFSAVREGDRVPDSIIDKKLTLSPDMEESSSRLSSLCSRSSRNAAPLNVA